MTVTLVSDNSVPSSLVCGLVPAPSPPAIMHRPNCRCGPWRAAVNFSARLLRIAGWLVCSYALRTPSLHLLGGGGDHDGVVTLGLARGRKRLGALFGGEKGPDLTLAQGRLPAWLSPRRRPSEPVLAAGKVSK